MNSINSWQALACVFIAALTAVPAISHADWEEVPLGWVETSSAPAYYYSWDYGWLYSGTDLAGAESGWVYAYTYGLGYLYFNTAFGGWFYSPWLQNWIYPVGSVPPGYWYMNGQWRQTPERSVYHVAEGGSDDAAGTLEAPFATIGKAIGLADANDAIRVRGGTYREQIRLLKSGELEFPISIEAYRDAGVPEEVIVSAYDIPVEGELGVGSWSDEGDGVYSIQIPFAYGTTPNNLLIKVDGASLVDARWPNVDSNFDIFRPDVASAEGTQIMAINGSNRTVRYLHSGLEGYADGAWTGAQMPNLQGKQWTPTTEAIEASGDGYVEFTYEQTTFGGSWNEVQAGDLFVLTGRKVAMDLPGEYFHDVSGRDGPARMLYIRMPEGKTPQNSVIEIKRRGFGFDSPIGKHWVVKDLVFDGCAILTGAGAENITFNGVSVFDVYSFGQPGYAGSVNLGGKDCSFLDGVVLRSTTGGIAISGDDMRVENNVIGHIFTNGIRATGGERLTARNNTVFDCGSTNIQITNKASLYLSNRAYHAGSYITDMASMNAWGSGDMDGMEVAWNVVHDNLAPFDNNRAKVWNGGQGIRADSGGGAGVSNFSFHHNITWGYEGNNQRGVNPWGLEPTQPNVGDAKIDVQFNTCQGGVYVTAGSNRDATGITLTYNYGDSVTDGAAYGTVAYDNASLADGNPLFFNAEVYDYRPLPGSPLWDGTPHRGAIGPGEVFPVAGAIWLQPQADVLSARFVETVAGVSAVGISGMPQWYHLPDGTMIRVDGTYVTNDLWHRYNVATHRAEGVFLLDYFATPSPVSVEISFDGGASWASVGTVLLDEGGSGVQPTPAVYDGLTDAANPLGVSDTGFGWDGNAWALAAASGGTVVDASTATVATGNLAAPSDYVFNSGAVNESDPDGSHIADLSPVGDGQYQMIRDSAGLFNFAEDRTYYFSFLISPSATDPMQAMEVDFLRDNTHSRRVFEFTFRNQTLSMSFSNATATLPETLPYTNGETYLVVGKVEAVAGAGDVVRASLYHSSESINAEPAIWDFNGTITDAVDNQSTLDRLGLKGTDGADRFDEFLLGYSFLDVTGIE